MWSPRYFFAMPFGHTELGIVPPAVSKFPGKSRLPAHRPPTRVWPSAEWSWLVLGLAWLASGCGRPIQFTEVAPGMAYVNDVIASKPWSVHVARFDLKRAEYQLVAAHANGTTLGLTTLSSLIDSLPSDVGTVVAGINGDFYQRETSAYAGDPRSLHIYQGQLLSAPLNACVWVDSAGQPHLGHVESEFKVVWPSGDEIPIGFNEERRTNAAVLYAPSLGAPSTRTKFKGRELVLGRIGDDPWLPLQLGKSYSAQVQEIREASDSPIDSNSLVLSLDAALVADLKPVSTGVVVRIFTTTAPELKDVPNAIGGGPILVRNGKAAPIRGPEQKNPPYSISSMFERHPRVAVGWNKDHLFLVLVDGRQKKLSVGMTLTELGNYMRKLGCQEAMNLDGGGSATFWFNGKVMNSPCDGYERQLANALVVVRKTRP